MVLALNPQCPRHHAIRFESKSLTGPPSPRIINCDVQFHLIHLATGRLKNVFEEMSASLVPRWLSDTYIFQIIPTCLRFGGICWRKVTIPCILPLTNPPKIYPPAETARRSARNCFILVRGKRCRLTAIRAVRCLQLFDFCSAPKYKASLKQHFSIASRFVETPQRQRSPTCSARSGA